jgi:hypothetical protein
MFANSSKFLAQRELDNFHKYKNNIHENSLTPLHSKAYYSSSNPAAQNEFKI